MSLKDVKHESVVVNFFTIEGAQWTFDYSVAQLKVGRPFRKLFNSPGKKGRWLRESISREDDSKKQWTWEIFREADLFDMGGKGEGLQS